MSVEPLYAVCSSAPWIITSRPVVPWSVTRWPLAPWVKVVPSCGLMSTLPGSPLLNSMVTRSYPGWVPVRTASTNATAGELVPASETGPAQTKAGRLESGGVADGIGLGPTVGVAVATELGLALGLGIVAGPMAVCRPRFDTTSTPITMAAISPVASPAIQKGPVRAGLSCSRAERTRANSAGLGDPLMASNSRLRSRRKSLLMSGDLLEGQVRSKPACGSVDSRLGRRLRDAQRARDLVQGQVEIEVQDQRQALVRTEPGEGSPQVGESLLARRIAPPFGFHFGRFHDRPPAPAPRHAALVGDDGQEPRAERAFVAAKLPQVAPGFHRSLLDGILGRHAVGQHHGREPVGRIEQRVDEHREGVSVTFHGPLHRGRPLLHHRAHHVASNRLP